MKLRSANQTQSLTAPYNFQKVITTSEIFT